ncbi:coiled-coil domain-containing protein 134-like [Topomyia yanbarensis]|uniref:coiled-coil domain-containing protein 134-like n=1 Tax=Topomyia yanbarensis TaxID=2498891 RepID=UPI00273B1F9F|nr:coiled-coil domain-containing protein 134-like [Topomyia yanbarensis]
MEKRTLFNQYTELFLTIIFIGAVALMMPVSAENVSTAEVKESLQITGKMYSNMFVRKREEQKQVVKRLASTDEYSKKYDLLQLALTEIMRIIVEEGIKLRENNINNGSDFPKDTKLIEAFARFVENTCFFAELVLRLPDMSYRILKGINGWRYLVIDALNYSRSFETILDPKSQELLGLLEQELDESKRTESYVNPYREDKQHSAQRLKKKKPKAKKGPQLTGYISKTEL